MRFRSADLTHSANEPARAPLPSKCNPEPTATADLLPHIARLFQRSLELDYAR